MSTATLTRPTLAASLPVWATPAFASQPAKETPSELVARAFALVKDASGYAALMDQVEEAANRTADRLRLRLEGGAYVATPAPKAPTARSPIGPAPAPTAPPPAKVEPRAQTPASTNVPTKPSTAPKAKAPVEQGTAKGPTPKATPPAPKAPPAKAAPRAAGTPKAADGKAALVAEYKSRKLPGFALCQRWKVETLKAKLAATPKAAAQKTAAKARGAKAGPIALDDASVEQLKAALAARLGMTLTDLDAGIALARK